MTAVWDLTLQQILMRVLTLLILSAVQGGVVAAMGVALGDPGPRHDGRLSPSPFRHVDLLGGVGLILFGLGWSKRVSIDVKELRGGAMGMVLVVAASTLALMATAYALHLLTAPALTTLPVSAGLLSAAFLRTAAALCLSNALFNLIPVPPLTGGQLLMALGIRIPERLIWVFAVALLAFAASGWANEILAPAKAMLAPLLLGRG